MFIIKLNYFDIFIMLFIIIFLNKLFILFFILEQLVRISLLILIFNKRIILTFFTFFPRELNK